MTTNTDKVCNCAGCGTELKSVYSGSVRVTSEVHGRIKGRPYCHSCLAYHPVPPGSYGPTDDESPGQSDAIRRMEDF